MTTHISPTKHNEPMKTELHLLLF